MAYYLKADGFKGSVSTKGFEGWIELQSISIPAVQQKAHAGIGDRNDRQLVAPQFADIEVKKLIDQSSVAWFQYAPNGKVIPKVQIAVVTTGSSLQEILRYTLYDVLLTHYSHNGRAGLPIETLHFNYNKLEMRFTPRDNKNKAGSPVASAYDLETADFT